MKRILSLILVIVLISCSLVSCDKPSKGNPEVSQHVHVFSKATCNMPKTCECGATEGRVSDQHNFEDGVCADCTKRLVVELARLVTNPATEKPIDGFYISRGENERVEYVTARVDIVDKALTQKDIYARVAIKMDQDALISGVYEWVIERNIYIPSIDSYDRSYLYGTLNASDFVDVDDITVTRNEGFEEEEVSEYLPYIPRYVDRIVTQRLISALENNPSRITVADIGFVNYVEEATTNKPTD